MEKKEISAILKEAAFKNFGYENHRYLDTATDVIYNIAQKFGNPTISQADLPMLSAFTYISGKINLSEPYSYALDELLLIRATHYLKSIKIYNSKNDDGQYNSLLKQIKIDEEDAKEDSKTKLVDEDSEHEFIDLPKSKKLLIQYIERKHNNFNIGDMYKCSSNKPITHYLETLTEKEAEANFKIRNQMNFAHEFLHVLKSEFTLEIFNKNTGFNLYNNIKCNYFDEMINDMHAIKFLKFEENFVKNITFLGKNDTKYMQRCLIDENSVYGNAIDIAEFLELLVGEKKLFMGSIINPKEFVKNFNKEYKKDFLNNKELNKASYDYFNKALWCFDNPWIILNIFCYYICEKPKTVKMINLKMALHNVFIKALTKKVLNINSYDTLAEREKNILQINAKARDLALIQEEGKGKYSHPNVKALQELEKICNKKIKEIDEILKAKQENSK